MFWRVRALQQSKAPVQQQMLQNLVTMPRSTIAAKGSTTTNNVTDSITTTFGFAATDESLPGEMQQRLQTSGPLLQQQSVIEQRKQLYQPQRTTLEALSTSSDSIVQMGDANGADWQEVVYQKIKSMKEMYLPELKNLYQEIVSEELQQDSLLQRPQNEQNVNLNILKYTGAVMLFLQLNKHDIQLCHKEKLLQAEKYIVSLLSSNRRRRSTLSLLQGQLLQSPTQLQQPQSLDRHQQQQAKPRKTAQLPVHQMSQLHQIDATDVRMTQQLGIKTGVLQQQQSVGQCVRSHHPQLKSGTSSPQLHQAPSPLVTQHPSLQIDQQNMLASLTKAGSPLQSATSPFVVPSPSTAWAPSPMRGDFRKVSTGLAIHTAAGNIKHQQATVACAPAQSLAVGTAGISASPLIAEFSTLDDTHANGSAVISGKSSDEQPLECLMKVVKNMSLKALNSSVSDISSVVSTIDRKAGSAPGNGSRAAVGEDLVSISKYLQARNYFTQDGPTGTKKLKLKQYATFNVISSSCSVNDSFWQLNGSEASESESKATSSVKRPRLKEIDGI